MPDRLRPQIEEFKARLDRLPSPTEPPPPTLEIIGRNHKERDWQHLLVHFLSGNESHGLEYELLRHVLTGLSNRSGFDFSFSHFDLDNVQIETEIDTSNGGRVDIVIWVPEAWFICWELKVHSSEGGTQTERYVEADSFERIELYKSDPGVTENYIYLSPTEEPAAEASEFHSVSWEWIASELQAFLEDSHGQYPARTTAQVEDFIGTIRSELSMTEYEENEQEKAGLYLDYYDEIAEVQRAFENCWETFRDNWGRRLADELEHRGVGEAKDLGDDYAGIEIDSIPGKSEQWEFSRGSNWAGFNKQGWRRDSEDPSTILTGTTDREWIGCKFFFRLKKNRESVMERSKFEVEFWQGNNNPGEFTDSFTQSLRDKIEEEDIELPPSAKITGSDGKPITATYDVPVEEYDDFFEAYTAAMATAFQDLVIDHAGLMSAIDEAFEEALKSE